MTSHFSKDFFIRNRQKLREANDGDGPLVVTANGLLQRGADCSYPFAQDANFWYLTGINDPDILLVMDADRDYLIVPERDASRTAFDGALDDAYMQKRSGINDVYEMNEGWEKLGQRLKGSKNAATIYAAPPYIERYGLYANPARARLIETIRTHNENIELTDVGVHLVHQRMIKQAPELMAMQTAIDITAASIKAATTPTKRARYTYEYELEAEITKGFRVRGASGHAFEPIVASGRRACTLHNVANNGKIGKGELVVIDVGAEVEGYAADITRTISRGPASKRQQAVYEAVLQVQQYAYGLLRPGVLMAEYEQKVEQYMGEKLKALGLIKKITREAVRAYYPHATSHYMGLNVHDAGDYSQPLAAGMVLTVEPGIYIPEEGIGIRIEDDVLITSSGIEILTQRLPSRL